ncbi:MAG: hypothetical protein V4692_10300 [Bdellovibrionota bacterium]
MKRKLTIAFLTLTFASSALAMGIESIYTTEAIQSLQLPPGSGTAKGLLGVIITDSKALALTLPKGLSLAPELIQPDGTYPVAMFVGDQTKLSVEVGDRKILIEKHYREATLSMTVVGPKSADARYTYTSKIVVDSVPAMLMGWALGYPKRLVKARTSDSGFHAEFSKNKPALDVELADPETYDVDAFERHYSYLKGQVQPTIGNTPFGFICFDFDWNFKQAKASPVNAVITFHDAFAGKELARKYVSPSLDLTPFGSLRIESNWRMSAFRKCD